MRSKWIHDWGYGQPWRQRQEEAILAGAPLPTVEDWVDQVDYVVKLVGAEHIGLGLDLMSGGWTCYVTFDGATGYSFGLGRWQERLRLECDSRNTR